MAPPAQSDVDELVVKILLQLSKTRYACSSLSKLASGTTNFVFRGILAQPISLYTRGDHSQHEVSETITTVIVKHSTAFAAVNKDFPVDVSRCVSEESMLNFLNGFSYASAAVRTPRLYHFDGDTNTQVLEDFRGVVDLESILMSSAANDDLSRPFTTSLGQALGLWLRSFHSWISNSAKSQLHISHSVSENRPMRELKFQITYANLFPILEQFPNVLAGHRTTVQEVKNYAREEFQKTRIDEPDDGWGIIHGDFWSGNVLLPEPRSPDEQIQLFIVDWEFAQFGLRAYDLGQMIGDFYERKHFRNIEAAVWAIEGFIEGYGPLSEDMAFRTAIHAGVQLITWVTRGPPLDMRPAWASRERAEEVVRLGLSFVLKGWEKDRKWFQDTVLAGLFTGNA